MKKSSNFILLFIGVLLIIGSIIFAFRSLLLADIVWGGFFPCCPYCAPAVWEAWTTLRTINMDAELFLKLHLLVAVLTFALGGTGIVIGIVIWRKRNGKFDA